MAFNISNFQQALSRDGARPNLFQIEIPDLGEDFSFMCKAAQIPGSTIGVVEVPYFGRAIKLAGNRTFADWTVTVINDEDFKIHDLLVSWMARINSHQGNVAATDYSGYTADATVVQYGKQGDRAAEFTLVDAFPVDLSPIDLDWGSNDTIEEFTVTFSYQYWTSTSSGEVEA